MAQKELESIKLPSIKSIPAIRANLNMLTEQIKILVACEGINTLFIETKSVEIDWVILRLAQQSQLYNNLNEPFEISRLKETAWTLLEKLEAYCSTKLGISIW
jgi:hypothetical protein